MVPSFRKRSAISRSAGRIAAQSLSDLVSMNKKQISIIDTAIINNNSPATLNHEASSSKEMTETFSTSFGTSQSFMKSLTMGEEFGSSSTDSRFFNKTC